MIQAYCELLKRRYAKSAPAGGEAFETPGTSWVGRSASRRLLRDILTYHADRLRGTGRLRAYRRQNRSQKAIENLEGGIAEANAEISYGPLPSVRIEEVHLLQLFQNLIGNALKYRSDEHLKIDISVRLESGRWLFSVRDNGIGIAPAIPKSDLRPCSNVSTPGKSTSGTGVALAICQKIVERYRPHLGSV